MEESPFHFDKIVSISRFCNIISPHIRKICEMQRSRNWTRPLTIARERVTKKLTRHYDYCYYSYANGDIAVSIIAENKQRKQCETQGEIAYFNLLGKRGNRIFCCFFFTSNVSERNQVLQILFTPFLVQVLKTAALS